MKLAGVLPTPLLTRTKFNIQTLTCISHRVSSPGRRGAVHSGVFDPRGAERVFAVRRAPRGEKTPLGAVHRRPHQKIGEICRLMAT